MNSDERFQLPLGIGAPNDVYAATATEKSGAASHRCNGERESHDNGDTAPTDAVAHIEVPNDDVLTVEQTAQLLHVHPKTVRQLFRRRQLPGGRKLGAKVIRFSRAAVLEWLRGNASVSRRRA